MLGLPYGPRACLFDLDGVRDFLASRDIRLPARSSEGSPTSLMAAAPMLEVLPAKVVVFENAQALLSHGAHRAVKEPDSIGGGDA
jgi:hypothetical protein